MQTDELTVGDTKASPQALNHTNNNSQLFPYHITHSFATLLLCMPGGRPPKVTPALKEKIADCFLVAMTDEQTADLVGVAERTIRRMRAGEFCPEIKKSEIERELKYRLKVWNSKYLPAGICWFLERKYPTQFAKPEVQLQINTGNVTNNTLIVTAEVAGQMGNRVKEADAKVSELFKRKELGPGNSSSEANSSPKAKK
jgi:hypothetical protein